VVSYANTHTDSNIFFSNLSCINLFAFHRHTWLPFNIPNNVNLWLDLERNYQSLLDKFLDWVCDAIPTKLNLVILWRFSCLVYRSRMLLIIIWEIWEWIYQIYYLHISLFCSWHENAVLEYGFADFMFHSFGQFSSSELTRSGYAELVEIFIFWADTTLFLYLLLCTL